ncbi:unnamed protein product [Auanema sp. JU1783]|nr:unnamed protein product [Auanema sp. JU1783]
MKFFVLLLALVSVAHSFDSTFKYGCDSTKCVYQFVVPEVISAYIDPQIFSADFSNLTNSMNALSSFLGSHENLSPTTSNQFLSAFDQKYQSQSPAINATVDTVANIDQTNYTALNADSVSLLDLSTDLVIKGDCFVAGTETSSYCGSKTKHTTTPAPSSAPATQPSGAPATQPSGAPATQPSGAPATQPSGASSTQPSVAPSKASSGASSTQPSVAPSKASSGASSTQPSVAPSDPAPSSS